MSYEDFLKAIRPKKGLLIFALFFLVSCISTVSLSYKEMKEKMEKPVSIYDANEENQYSCMDVQFMTQSVATSSNSEKEQNAFIVWNAEELSLVSLNGELEKDFKDILDYSYSNDENAKAPETKKICGYTTMIPDNLKKLTIESYNQIFNTNTLSSDNFYEVFGIYYIDSSKTPKDDFISQAAISGIVSIVGIVLLIIYLNKGWTTKKTLKKYDNKMDSIKMNIGAPDAIHEAKAKIFLTKEYLINYANGLQIYEYKDIVWIYPYELRRNGFVQSRSVYVVTSNSKVHSVANLSASKKNNILFDEIYQEFIDKLPDALHGYTKENREEVKNRYRK